MMRKGDEMDDERLMSDDAVEDAVLRYLDESPEVVSGMAPSRDLWPDIEARIGARVLPLGRDSVEVNRVHRMRRRPGWVAMAAAAAFLVASTAGVTYVLTKRFVPPGAATQGSVATQVANTTPAATPVEVPAEVPTRVASATPTQDDAAKRATGEAGSSASTAGRAGVASHENEAQRSTPRSASRGPSTSLARYPVTGSDEARVTYDDEISRLHGVLDARRDQLDPATVATVERNLRIIDDAITQARTALVKDPHSRMLNEQLDRTLAKKTQLLRAATLLPSV
jgi:hypothetical protein